MSVENLKKYGELCANDTEIHKKAKEIGIEDMAGQIAYAKSLGLEFSREDFAALAKEAGLDGANELSEEELKKVAGGCATLTLVAGLAAGCFVVGSALVLSGTMPGW
ncbi:MAG: Nif11-like leader peptide family RiPP precursor, partial [Synergistaceae bacterium]|jgi:predicted ribosomally synthesized peptide with nif11-like leader|nr:Nif11-like leader peptide family RiPP precursor [Synergistaceae bacterium]